MPDGYDEETLAEALLYVAKHLEVDPSGGAIRINKILYNADFGHMRAYGEPITGADYQKLEHGPTPRRFVPVRDRLIATGAAELREETYLGHTIHRLVAVREPDVSRFAPSERELLDQAIAAAKGRSGGDLSAASHREPGWQMVDEGESIPYETAFLRQPVVTAKVRKRIAELAAAHLNPKSE